MHSEPTETEQRIRSRVAEIEQLLQEKDINPAERGKVFSYDMNGPLTDKDSSELEPRPGLKEELADLSLDEDTIAVLNSGYDTTTLQHFRGKLDADQFELIGELGSVYQINGTTHQVMDEPEQDLIQLKQKLYRTAAEHGVKLLEQGNSSTVVGCTRVEGEGTPDDPRGETYKHFTADPGLTTEELWESLRDTDGFQYDEEQGLILYDDEPETVEELGRVLRHEHTFAGVRFTQLEDGTLAFYRDRKDNGMAVEDAHEFMEQVLEGTDWEPSHNPDWGTDYVKSSVEPSKEKGVNAFAQHYFETDNPDDYLVFHVGDKPDDVMEGDNTVFFAQQGSPAVDYCEENGINYIEVRDGIEYTQIISSLQENVF